jgi:hypothetical protein
LLGSSKHISAAMNQHATIEEMLEVELCTWPMIRLYSEDQWEKLARKSEASQSCQFSMNLAHDSSVHTSSRKESRIQKTEVKICLPGRAVQNTEIEDRFSSLCVVKL